jgi:acyl-CoA synthetase (AMP-forming)/AMP-acid ligase II
MTASVSWELDRENEEFGASVRMFVDRQVLPPGRMSVADNLSQLLATPLQPQREQWYPAAQAELLRTARARHSAEVASQLGGYARLGAVHLTSALPKTRTGKIMRRLLRDVVEHGGPQGDTSAMEDLAGLQAVPQAVAAEAAPTV